MRGSAGFGTGMLSDDPGALRQGERYLLPGRSPSKNTDTRAVKTTYRHGDGRQNTVAVATSRPPYYDCCRNSARRLTHDTAWWCSVGGLCGWQQRSVLPLAGGPP
ncbi:hypothetical protein NDU88_001381 [Pleurodeles waltl]|uniref:Uncharacterized protein n=1 Tax=Pleurodeles waltl TaxID=8319 RepID=A0AAV7TI57_PLEWA|nr:hypothetical protein NDU88_001381 [Pleurodeles waltl]